MRLINTKTLQIEEFTGRKVPRYAILSHTWGNEELTFQDWLYVQNQSPPRWGWTQIPGEIERMKSKEGYIKVVKVCEHAQRNKPVCQWLWADTVCIDKASSAELSEAINSMFEWYRRSEICYAFLVDVSPMTDEELTKCSQRTSRFRQSRWFRRGWTLQELIAPWSVVFLSNSWTALGTKSTLAKHIATITSIPESFLSGNWSRIRDQASIVQKMSWAARRQTTRIEDQAYSLMGLFDINMPLLYGEGERSFVRLQEEIIKKTEDLSFLAWRSDRSQTFFRDRFVHWKLPPLAESPSQFFSARNETKRRIVEGWVGSTRVSTVNTGILIHRPLLATFNPRFMFAVLNCEAATLSPPTWESIWIPLVGGLLTGFSRSSFPQSTITTVLDPTHCHMYSLKWDQPLRVLLRHLYEPSPERLYFRKPLRRSTMAKPCRQIGILPVFATQSLWIEGAVASYPHFDQDALIFSLAQVNENLYHGTFSVRVPARLNRGRMAGVQASTRFGIHFLVVFENNRTAFWSATPVDDLELYPSMDILQHTTTCMTEKTFPAARPDGDAASRVPKRSPGLAMATHRDSYAFAQMDNRWYKFRSAGLEESSFDTYINIVMFGVHSLPLQIGGSGG